jgi:[NiFe] hydrogenase diaphorase moiety small subunit
MFCERSGNCELQAQAYRHGLLHHEYRYQYPDRKVEATHPDVMIDHNRCILCARCVRASRDLDGKHVFQFVGRGPDKRVGINARARLSDTDVDMTDEVMDVCPVGALMRKRVGFAVPVGERKYDGSPIGSDIEQKSE